MAILLKKLQLSTIKINLNILQKCFLSSQDVYTPRRALLYVPGNDLKKITKSFNLDVDCICLDCEDGVALRKKEEARATIASVLDKGKPAKSRNYDLGVRVNSIDTPNNEFEKDTSRIFAARHLPDTILLPKVENIAHLSYFTDCVEKNLTNEESKVLKLVIYIESAAAFVNLIEICKKLKEIQQKSKILIPEGLVFGSDDFCANIGATRTDEADEVVYARQKLVLTAKAFNLQAIDMVYIKYKDLDGLKIQSLQGARFGFTGKQVIHPAQVEIVQDAFLPSTDAQNWAKELLTAFNQHQDDGKGAFSFRGSMIDMPTVKQAQNIVQIVQSVRTK